MPTLNPEAYSNRVSPQIVMTDAVSPSETRRDPAAPWSVQRAPPQSRNARPAFGFIPCLGAMSIKDSIPAVQPIMTTKPSTAASTARHLGVSGRESIIQGRLAETSTAGKTFSSFIERRDKVRADSWLGSIPCERSTLA